MSDIQSVIERSRHPGSFRETRHFTVASERAIEKMRKFALVSKTHYVLELIQGAVANGATYLDLRIDNDETAINWIGGGFTEEELNSVFDYLFADKSDESLADIRQIALGLNGLIDLKPTEIIIESGDGTIGGTHRATIDPSTLTITMGVPSTPLRGTYIRATDLNRHLLHKTEESLIDEKCLTLAIPILVNDRALFGYTSTRSPNLFGCAKVVKFDEGDLYGTIGVAKGPNTDNFKILTWGVWISSVKQEFRGVPFGGIVGFDKLRKTADHATVVADDRYDEMWARIGLYARKLLTGEEAEVRILTTDQSPVTLSDFLTRCRDSGEVFLFRETDNRALVKEFESVMRYTTFVIENADFDLVKSLATAECKVYTPECSEKELFFLRRRVVGQPMGRMLMTPAEFAPSNWNMRVFAHLNEKNLPLQVGTDSPVWQPPEAIRVHTPAAIEPSVVRFVAQRRMLWSFQVHNIPPGFVLDVLYPVGRPFADLSPEAYEPICIAAAESVSQDLSTIHSRIATEYASGTIRPKTSIAMHVAQAISLDILFGFTDGAISARMMGGHTDQLLDHTIFKTLTGDDVSVNDILAWFPKTGGVVYGRIPQTPFDDAGLDHSMVLDLTVAEESVCAKIFGSATYVRVDERNVLALSESGVVRDYAKGILEYEDETFLYEGRSSSDDILKELQTQLIDLIVNEWMDYEARRNAVRHLIWMIGHDRIFDARLRDIALFRSVSGEMVSLNQLAIPVEMGSGWPVENVPQPAKSLPKTAALSMNPYVYHALKDSGLFGQPEELEATPPRSDAVLVREVHEPRAKGWIGLMPAHATNSLMLIGQTSRDVISINGIAERLGCSGEFQIPDLTPGSIKMAEDVFIEHATLAISSATDLAESVTERDQFLEIVSALLRSIQQFVVCHRVGRRYALDMRVPTFVHNLLLKPWFATSRGVLTARSLFGEFEDPASEIPATEPPFFRDWVRMIQGSATISTEVMSETLQTHELESWLQDEVRTLPFCENVMVKFIPDPKNLELRGKIASFGAPTVLLVNSDHPLVQSASEVARERIWLLLGVAARINELLVPVLNSHELEFQQTVLRRWARSEYSADA